MENNQIYQLTEIPKIFAHVQKGYYNFNVEYKNNIFMANVTSSSRELTLYNQSGSTVIGKFINDSEIIEKIKNNINIFLSGKFPCVRCNRPLDKNEIRLKYFAANYCDNCVTSELLRSYSFDYKHLD